MDKNMRHADHNPRTENLCLVARNALLSHQQNVPRRKACIEKQLIFLIALVFFHSDTRNQNSVLLKYNVILEANQGVSRL